MKFKKPIYFLILSLLGINPVLPQTGPGGYIYISPLGNSGFHNRETSILVRFGDKIDAKSLKSDCIQVNGQKSGTHQLSLSLSADSSTIIVKPLTAFEYGEKVIVNVLDGIHTLTNKELPEVSFCFYIRPAKPADEAEFPDYSPVFPKSVQNLNTTVHTFDIFHNPLIKIKYSNHPAEGNFFTTLSIGSSSILYIMDNQGFPVYMKIMPEKVIHLKPWPGGICSYFDYDKLSFITLDQEMNVLGNYQMQNGYETNMHEFVLCSNGHSFLIGYDKQIMDMSGIIPGGKTEAVVTGAIIQELDEYKNLIFQWRTWDHYKITDSYLDLTGLSVDYAHVNSIDPDTDSTIIISARHMNEITRINKKNGSLIWRMGGRRNQFQFSNDYRNFSGQHTAIMQKNGILTLYDNGLDAMADYSRGIEYFVDEKNKQVQLLKEYIHAPPVFGKVMGNMQQLENGNVLVYWGSLASSDTIGFSEYDVDNQLLFEAGFYNSGTLKALPAYRVYKEKWEPSFFSLSTDSILFDSTETGQVRTATVSIKNISKSIKTVDSVYFTRDVYEISNPFPLVLSPGQEINLEIRFAPKADGNFSGYILFCSGSDSVFYSKKLWVDSKSSITTGLHEFEPRNQNFRLWPNPFTDVLNFDARKMVKQIDLFDFHGKRCFYSNINVRQGTIYPKMLKSGIYLLRILFADNSAYTVQVIKI
ncbi:MAG: aryl-sulfate sulfotransferase [Bacteroidales bacterium]